MKKWNTLLTTVKPRFFITSRARAEVVKPLIEAAPGLIARYMIGWGS